MASTKISAAEAMKHFRSAGIKVRTATPVKVKGEDGVVRDAMEVKDEQLSEEHILGAALRDGGTAVITTIDGTRHEARVRAAKE